MRYRVPTSDDNCRRYSTPAPWTGQRGTTKRSVEAGCKLCAGTDHSGFQASGSHLSGFSDSSFPSYSPGASLSSLDGSGLQSRLSLSSSFRSPSPSDKMTDLQSLSTSSFWSYGRPSLDLIRKNQYKLASRSSQSHKSRTDDSDNMGEEVWRPLGVTDDDLFLWIERLRKGRNNMFHAILFFLYHIQHKENG
ncbi:hypothetical protein MAR_004962, partial [Mya arenaria]